MPETEQQKPDQRRERRDAGLYGRRKGKALRSRHSALIADVLPKLRVPLDAPLDPHALFPDNMRELRLEIGFGGGERLADEAARQSDIGFFGCEPFVNGVAKLLAEIDDRGLKNIRLQPDDAGQLLDVLPEASLDAIYIFYPDPWPKRRHKERRFISDRTLVRLARVLKPGGQLRFATDIDDYAGWTLARILRSPDFVWPAISAKDWLIPWDGWVQTRYEAKARREGRPSAYLTFLRR